jgi:hypothetical protein
MELKSIPFINKAIQAYESKRPPIDVRKIAKNDFFTPFEHLGIPMITLPSHSDILFVESCKAAQVTYECLMDQKNSWIEDKNVCSLIAEYVIDDTAKEPLENPAHQRESWTPNSSWTRNVKIDNESRMEVCVMHFHDACRPSSINAVFLFCLHFTHGEKRGQRKWIVRFVVNTSSKRSPNGMSRVKREIVSEISNFMIFSSQNTSSIQQKKDVSHWIKQTFFPFITPLCSIIESIQIQFRAMMDHSGYKGEIYCLYSRLGDQAYIFHKKSKMHCTKNYKDIARGVASIKEAHEREMQAKQMRSLQRAQNKRKREDEQSARLLEEEQQARLLEEEQRRFEELVHERVQQRIEEIERKRLDQET